MAHPFALLHIKQMATAPWATGAAAVLRWQDIACWSSSQQMKQKDFL